MKITLAFLLAFCIAQNTHAQKILVPYRSSKLFGLSDGNGKIIVNPAYDHVHWQQGAWFETNSKTDLKDTLETAPHKFHIRNTTAKLSGLIHNGKVILKDEPYDDYEIITGKLIAAKYEGRPTNLTKVQYKKYGDRRKFYSLFNLQGKNLYPDNFKRIQKMDTAGVNNNKNGCKYILLWVVNFSDRHSLIVFDADKQEISDWLVRDAYKIEPDRNREKATEMLVGITDSNRHYSFQLLDYKSGKFLLQPTTETPKGRSKRDDDNTIAVQEVSGMGMGNGRGISGDDGSPMVEMPPALEGKPSHREPKFITYFSRVKDSLFITNGPKIFKRVPLPIGSKVILMEANGMTQYQPVITKQGNQFFIVADEQPGTKPYDSLVYFGKYFLAWKKINGQTKAGIITSSDSIIMPFQYDSLYVGIRYVDLVDKTPASNTPHYQMVFKEADSKYDYTIKPYNRTFINYVTVFTKGKCGVITIEGDTVIPVRYDMIGKNSLQHSRPMEDDFIIIKQNGKYGITALKHAKGQKHPEMSSNTIQPVFEYIPGFYYKNYYGIKNFNLVGLYNEQREFMGFATEQGKLFYDDK